MSACHVTGPLAVPHGSGVPDRPPDPRLDALARAAGTICRTQAAQILLTDEALRGFDTGGGVAGVAQGSLVEPFFTHAICGDTLLEVPDAAADPRFAGSTLVTARHGLRFFAGVPLCLPGGGRIGLLCVQASRPRRLSGAQRGALRALAQAAAAALAAWQFGGAQMAAAARASAAAARSRRKYEATPGLLYSIDASGAIVRVSDAWLERFGYTREEVIGRRAVDFFTPESREFALQISLPAFYKTGRRDKIPYQLLTKSGEVVDVLLSARQMSEAESLNLRSLVVLEDVTERRRAEQALAGAHHRLADVVAATGVGTWEWNLATGALLINERWAEIIGHDRAAVHEITRDFWVNSMHDADRPRVQDALRRHMDGETPRYQAEYRIRHAAGHFIWILSQGQLMSRTATGAPEWMLGTIKDITDRKQQEEALRASAELLAYTGKVARVGGWAADLVTGTLIWSSETYRLHGRPPDYQPTLQGAIAQYAPEVQGYMREALQHALQTGTPWDLELPLIRTDGQRIWVRHIGEVTMQDGKAVRISGALQDISDRVAERLRLQSAQERVALATEAGNLGIWDWDMQSDLLVWDEPMYRLYGAEAGALDTMALWRRHLHPDDLQAAERVLAESLEGLRGYHDEFRIIRGDGSVRFIKSFGKVVRNAAGQPVRMAGTDIDVTESRQLAIDLANQHELLRVTLRSIGDGVITTDAAGNTAWLNPVAERLTGWTTAEAAGRPLTEIFDIVNEVTGAPAENPVAICLRLGKVVALANQTLLRSRTSETYGIEDSAAPIRNDKGQTLGAVLVFHDVTEQRQLSGEMSYRATHDALTGLLNRSEFENRLRYVLHKAHADHSRNSLLFIDLDQFKLVNDSCGHAAGDQLLVQFAKLLSELVRASDSIARLGGDEFAVVLDNCPAERALPVAQKICDAMDDFRFQHDGQRFRIGASIGLVPVDENWPDIGGILQAADSSCYAAKEEGRNRVHAWYDTDHTMRIRHGETQWATRLARALDEDRFLLFAQRIQPLNAGERGIHAEVLLRLQESDGSVTKPGAFLPAAERFHFASRIDRHVLRRVTEWMNAARTLEDISTICVNLSGQSVGDRAFHRWALSMLTAAGPEICRRLCLEITETAAVTNLADAALFIEQVRGVGVRVALDDFGAGASSFGYLKSLSVDYLKIDGQFVRDLVSDALDEAAVRCFAEVASIAGLQTIAEFVEEPAVRDKLHLMGVDFAQGYLIHQPAPIAELLAHVAVLNANAAA